MSTVEGQEAVNTGATGTIGQAIAVQTAKNSTDLFLVAYIPEELVAAPDEITAVNRVKVSSVANKLATLEGCEQVDAALMQQHKSWNIQIGCAGLTGSRGWPNEVDEEWLDRFPSRFLGAVRMTRLMWHSLEQTHSVVMDISIGMAATLSLDFRVGGVVDPALANFSKPFAEQGPHDDAKWINPIVLLSSGVRECWHAAPRGTDTEEFRKQDLDETSSQRVGEGRYLNMSSHSFASLNTCSRNKHHR